MNQTAAALDAHTPAFPVDDLRWRAIEKAGLDRDPEFWRAMHAVHGDVVHFTGSSACTGVVSVDIVDAIMRRDGEQMSRGFLLNTLGKIMLGRRSLLSLEGSEHRAVRGLWAPTFATSAIRSDHAVPIARDVAAFADRVGTTTPIDILEAMSLITLRTAARILLGDDTEKQADEFSKSVYAMLDTEMEATRHPLGTITGLVLNVGTFIGARSRMRASIAEAVDALVDGGGQRSFLARLAEHRDPDTGRAFRRSELIDAGVASLAAATHTTSLLLSWTFFLLASRPGLQDQAHDEIVAACGPLGIDAESVDQVRHLTFCRRLLLETMRLYPPLWIVHRSPKEDYEAGGHLFRGGRLISIPIYAMHRDPRNYERPSEYLPDRWERKPPRGAYLPFGAGGRGCLGESLAMTQALMILSVFLARFRITSETRGVRAIACGYLLKSSPAVMVRLEPR
jgi:cytochrome P450